MSFKTTYILFGMLFGLIVLIGLTQQYAPKPGDDRYVAIDMHNDKVKPDDIKTVEIARARPTAETLTFVREGKSWKMTSPLNTRVEPFLVDNLITSMADLHRVESSAISSDLKENGLAPPAAVITLTKNDGTIYKLNLGRDTGGPIDSQYVLLSTPARPDETLAIRRRDLETAFKDLNDFRSKDLLGDMAINSVASTQSVALTRFTDPKNELVLKRVDGKNNLWRFEKPGTYGPADYAGNSSPTNPGITGVRDLLQALDVLRVAYNPTPEKPLNPEGPEKPEKPAEPAVNDFVANNIANPGPEYGLDAASPATLRIEVVRADETPGSANAAPRKGVLLIGKKLDKEDKYYARLENENNVVKLPAKSVEPILNVAKDLNSIRDKDLVHVDQHSQVDAIDVKNSQGLLKLRKTGTPPKWRIYDQNGTPTNADLAHVDALITALSVPRQVTGFPDATKEDRELGLGDTDATGEVTLWVDALKAAKDEKVEPKMEKPTIKLLVGARKENSVFVKREQGGDTLRLEVPAALVEKVAEGRVAYLDRTLPSFPADSQFVKVQLVRNGETFEVERETPKDPKDKPFWKLTQPADLKDRTAEDRKINTIIQTVMELNNDKPVSEKASEADLDKYGLRTPEFKVVVTTKTGDKTEDHVYLFGSLNEAKTGRYAKLGERDLIFEVRPEVVNKFQGDLVPHTVFAFDSIKVKSVKLIGWKEGDKPPVTLELSRKPNEPATWLGKTDAGDITVDSLKVEDLVRYVSTLQTDRFLSFKNGPKPEYKLDEKERALYIEMTLEGMKEPITLTVGAPVGEGMKEFAAMASSLPGDVFVVPAGPNVFDRWLTGGVKFFTKEAK
jgi:hypothetical protein